MLVGAWLRHQLERGAHPGVSSRAILVPAGSIELKLHDMVRAAKSSEHCTIKMAKENAAPRFSIFHNKRMRGWWPFIKLKDQEDEEREEREAKHKKKKKKKWSSSVKPEDVEFTDPSGNKYFLTVRQGAGGREWRVGDVPLLGQGNLSCIHITCRGSSDPSAHSFVQGPSGTGRKIPSPGKYVASACSVKQRTQL